jgi:hypothetical protein
MPFAQKQRDRTMPAYRIFFRRKQHVDGHYEFDADDDATALWIADQLCDTCSDVCDEIELWNGSRRIDIQSAAECDAGTGREHAQAHMREIEEILLQSRSTIARSHRLRAHWKKISAAGE